ncbi:dephospho-CoA kinase [Aquabacter spiritensis]|uniref:Dephospho-CoA kinase n=1 Tax=Aquabacter spiritensis TaxID=933073 RepID=A0A4R3M3R2_9HYPH|nr:dephospho-CoA kinase [Aquabacter spiritensis]TCT05957.1 dephospho-CoA kinase [Aquabacter spiritensis]
MWVLGLTGSIGMGKSATAGLFAEAGIPVYDADARVHALYRGAAVAPVEAAFPGVARDGAIDRAALSRQVLGDPEAMKRLEAIVHPLVREEEAAFLAAARAAAARLVVLDIPLLFETGGAGRVDAVAVVSAAKSVQAARVLARPGMTPERFALILDKQMADSEKRRRAHFVIDTGRGFPAARHQVRGIVRALAGPGRRFGSDRRDSHA